MEEELMMVLSNAAWQLAENLDVCLENVHAQLACPSPNEMTLPNNQPIYLYLLL